MNNNFKTAQVLPILERFFVAAELLPLVCLLATIHKWRYDAIYPA